MRKNVWKDATGGSIFAKDNETRGQVSLVNQGIQVPVNVLPAEAKLVIHQNQYRRKWAADEDEDETALNDASSDNEDMEENYKPPQNKRTTLGDFLGNDEKSKGTGDIGKIQPKEQVADYLLSPSNCISTVIVNISLLQSLPLTDPSLPEIINNLKGLKQVLIQFVEQPQQEEIMLQLLAQVEVINDIESKYSI